MTRGLVLPGPGDGGAHDPAADVTARAMSDPPGEAAAGPPASTPDLATLVGEAVRDELDGILPHVVAAIRRDRAFDELRDRLGKAERLLATRRERPLAVAVHQVLNRLRHLDFDQAVKASLEAELANALTDAGFTEFGQVGEDYDPDRHDALSGRAADGRATVTEVDASGLGSFGDVVVRAQVQVAPRASVQPQAAAEAGRPATEQPDMEK